MTADTKFVARPHRIRLVAVPVAVVLFLAFSLAGVLLKGSSKGTADSTGVYFHTSDQFAMVGIGIVLALAVLLLTWPMVRADEQGVQVRNMLTSRTFAWADVRGVSFPDGARWARIELAADEYMAVLAIQAADGERAVSAIRELRGRFRAARGGE